MAGLNFPVARKLWGVNIAAKESYGVGSSYVHAWKELFRLWEWDSWIKPQIDYAVANGINCIRLIGSLEGVFAGTFSQATYSAHWQQLVDYCAGLGVFVYFTGGNCPQVSAGVGTYESLPGDGGAMTDQQIADGINATLADLATRTNIIGVDAMQEQGAWGPGMGEAAPVTRTLSIAAKIRAGGTTRPITFSTADRWTDASPGRSWMASIASALDYLDFHFYVLANYNATNPIAVGDIDFWRTTYPTLDIVCGELGSPESSTHDTIASFFRSVLTAFNVGDPKVRGAMMWAVQDGESVTSNAWGMFSTAWAPRIARVNLMRQFTGGSLAARN